MIPFCFIGFRLKAVKKPLAGLITEVKWTKLVISYRRSRQAQRDKDRNQRFPFPKTQSSQRQ